MWTDEKIDLVMTLVRNELVRATKRHGTIQSPHEGKAVIEEELDELWDEIKVNKGRTVDALEEAIQVAAMGAKYVVSLAEDDALRWLVLRGEN